MTKRARAKRGLGAPTLSRRREAAGADPQGFVAPPPPPLSHAPFWRGASGVFALALAVRLLHLWQLRRSPFFSLLIGDALGYDAWAQRIAAGDWVGSGVFYQAPLYPYTLGLLYALFGRDLASVRIAQAVLGAAACALIALAGRRLFGSRAGLAAGLLLALYAPAIFFDGLIQKATLDLVILCWLLWLVALLSGEPTRARCFWAGTALGCLALTRENAIALVPIFLFWLLWRRRHEAALPLAFVIGFGAVLAPVAVRNLVVGGELHLTTAQLGPNLYIGNHEGATGTYASLRRGRGNVMYEQRDATTIAEAALGRTLGSADVSRYWRRRALDWISSHPGAWLGLTIRKFLLFWNVVETTDTEDLYSHSEWSLPLRLGGAVLHFGVLAPLGLLGAWFTRDRWRELWILYALCGVYVLSVVLFYVLARYRYPLVPLLALFAGAGLIEIPAWWRRSGTGDRLRTAALVGVAFVVCNWPLQSIASMQAITRYNLGCELKQAGRSEEAIEQFRTALELQPDFANARSNLGVLLAAKGGHDEALRLYREALADDPENPSAYNNLGQELATRGRLPEAIESLRRSLELDPWEASAHYNLGTALASAGQVEEAMRELAESIRLEPTSAAAHNNLGILLVSSGRFDEGIEHFRSALRLRPDFAESAANLERAEALDNDRRPPTPASREGAGPLPPGRPGQPFAPRPRRGP